MGHTVIHLCRRAAPSPRQAYFCKLWQRRSNPSHPAPAGTGLPAKTGIPTQSPALTPLDLDGHPGVMLCKHRNAVSALICEAFSSS